MAESSENLVNDRWKERRQNLKEKLESGLSIISARRKYVVANPKPEPFPDGAFYRLWWNQIWEDVFDYMGDHSDVTNAFLTCKSFEKLLKERLEVKLLPQAMHIMRGTDHIQEEQDAVQQERFNCLGIRGVSRSWKKVADSLFFESIFLGDMWHLKTYSFDWSWQSAALCTLYDEDSVDKAIECFSNRGQNSPALRQLRVHGQAFVEEEEDDVVSVQNFYDKLVRFVESHGHSVWYFMYERVKFSRNPSESYEDLWRLLVNMPNLKAFEMDDYLLDDDGDVEEERALIEAMSLHPFPKLESLKYFHSKCECHAFLDEVYTTCVNLKSLCNTGAVQQGRDSPTSASLPLEFYSEPLDLGFPHGEHNPMIVYPAVTWPLKVLHITWGSEGFDNTASWWPALNRFSETLCELWLFSFDSDEKPVIEKDSTVPLSLPRLKSLEIEMVVSQGSVCVDDLIPLKCLESLTWNCEYQDGYNDINNQIKLTGLKERMRNSNIWGYFPNLMELDFPANGDCADSLKYSRRGSTLFCFRDEKLIKEEEIHSFPSTSAVIASA